MEVLLPRLCALLQANEAQLLETKDMAELFDSSSGCQHNMRHPHTIAAPRERTGRGGSLCRACAERARGGDRESKRASGRQGGKQEGACRGGGRQTVRETSYARK